MTLEQSKKDLENYDNITLTPEEAKEALRLAREKKHFKLQEEYREARASEVRRQLTEQWSYGKVKDFAIWRSNRMFNGKINYNIEETNSNARKVFELLCCYFSRDANFTEKAINLGIENPNLQKGILLSGAVGNGKTTLMKIFQVNQRQVFMIRSASEISNLWQTGGDDAISGLLVPHMLPINDSDNFYHRFAGLCLDDCGTEEIRNHYGNKKNVIGDMIEARYFNGALGPYLHMTTNLTGLQLQEHYGKRVSSRLIEMMNIVHLKGSDRRV
jgi:DNA replication protein DnaC